MLKLTLSTKSQKENVIIRAWHLVNAEDQILGRISTQISQYLQGKQKTNIVNYLDAGDYVVVVNASKVKTTGKKPLQKTYTRYSGYPGGLKIRSLQDMMIRKPEQVIQNAVSGMLPKNKHRKKRMGRLFIFKDDKHTFSNKFNSSTP